MKMNASDKTQLLAHVKIYAGPDPAGDRRRISGLLTALYWTKMIDWHTYQNGLYYLGMGYMGPESSEIIREMLDKQIQT